MQFKKLRSVTEYKVFLHPGCWGIKIGLVRSKILRVAENMFTIDHLQEYDYDQVLLDIFIWPIARNNVVI
jgi:hypothetical protein